MSINTDGDFSVAAVNGPRKLVFPFPRDRETFYTEQRWIQFEDDFRALALNTPDENDPTLFLVDERDFNSQPGGIIEWTRIYSRIPKPRDDYGTLSYNFPGYMARIQETDITPWGVVFNLLSGGVERPGRAPRVSAANSRTRFDYFLCGAGGQYETPNDIPIIAEQRYVYGPDVIGTVIGRTVQPGSDLPDRILYDEQTGAGHYSIPNVQEWVAMVEDGTEVVAEDSAIRNWMGNIFERATRYVVAK